ncbi:MAG: T9SS type A sorting domain-containing protein [Flavobacteriales bacterium]|nr:T9SS type A sorting domain-containing protein [Flavobacteriales bacterium]
MKKIILLFFIFTNSIFAQNFQITEVGNLPVKVANNAVCEGFINGNPYLFSFGGIDSTKIYSGIHLKSYRYNIQTGTVLQTPDLPDSQGKIAAAASRIDSVIYIIGGYHVSANGSEVSSNKIHRYNINTNAFLTDGTDIPIAIDDHVQAVWKDSLIYIITGWSNNGNVPNVQLYNPFLDSWTAASPTPNNNNYKSFGASGTIIGDTIYYFGGASMVGAFNVQNQLRKGVINPNNPTDISWSFEIPESQIKGYRMACTRVNNQIHWIGGSGITYNFNGIAYNGSGGVPTINRDLYFDFQTSSWLTNSAIIPMDLRGIANVNDSVKYIAGGMILNQEVTNKIYKLEWSNTITSIKESENDYTIFPNPSNGNFQIKASSNLKNITILNTLGGEVFSAKNISEKNINIDVRFLSKGTYIIKLNELKITEKLLIY